MTQQCPKCGEPMSALAGHMCAQTGVQPMPRPEAEPSIHNLVATMERQVGQWLKTATDDQLRAESMRRWPDGMAAWLHFAERDRDEWKRRAEAAEARLTNPSQCLRIKTDEGDLVPLGHVQDCGRIEVMVTRVDNERLPVRSWLAERLADPAFATLVAEKRAELDRADERGPGIASTKPDNELWGPLDVDRLCDDA